MQSLGYLPSSEVIDGVYVADLKRTGNGTGTSIDAINDGVVGGRASTSEAAVYINGRTIDVSSNFTTEPKFEAINSNNQFVGRFSTGPLGSDSHGLIGTPITT